MEGREKLDRNSDRDAEDVAEIADLEAVIFNYRADLDRWQEVARDLAEALRFHEERRINPTSRGGPALAKYDALTDGTDDAR